MRRKLERDGLEFSSRSVKEIEEIRPQLHAPFRIAVAPPLWREDLHWTSAERAEIESWKGAFAEAGIASDIVLIPSVTYEMGSGGRRGWFEQVREAAARHHADALLVIRDIDDASTWGNPLSVLYATIVGCWIVPGSTAEAVSMMQGVVIDNRNEYLLASYESEGASKTTKPINTIDVDDLRAGARVAALRELKSGLLARAKVEMSSAGPPAATGP